MPAITALIKPTMSVRVLPDAWSVGPPAPPVVALLVRVLYIAIITLVSVWVWGYLGGVSLSPTYVSEGVNETGAGLVLLWSASVDTFKPLIKAHFHVKLCAVILSQDVCCGATLASILLH